MKPYLLIAEDDIDDVDFFIAAFSDRCPQVAVKHVPDGEEVLDLLKNCQADELPIFLLLDYKMPLASAVDILHFLYGKEHFSLMRKAVWSTSDRETEIEECRRLGAQYFFKKPAGEEEWTALVSEICGYVQETTV